MVEEAGGIVQCPSCDEKFSFEPASPNYEARDDNNKVVTRETAEHMAIYRVRCANCTNNFCTGCGMKPYHIGMNCAEAEFRRDALKCRFCWEPLVQPSISHEDVFMDVCRQQECIDKMNKSCNKIHLCGHKCHGFKGEINCLPCLNKDCILEYNHYNPS